MQSKYSKILTIVLIIVVILIIGLLVGWGVSALSNKKVVSDAEDATSAFQSQINANKTNNTKNTTNDTEKVNIINPYSDNMINIDPTLVDPDANKTSNDKPQYNGFTMLGYIEIPKTKIKLPVLEEVTKKALETSVAVLNGPGLNKPGNTVIVGHNYRNGTFFSDNGKLTIGDKIYITGENGETLSYTIYKKYQTTPEDADYATRTLEAGAKEITLSTCTDDSGARIVIWAKAD